MLKWLKRRRLSAEARRKLLIIAARSEEAVVETHVSNAIELLHALGDEVDLNRGIELYIEMMSLDDTLSGAVTNRILARLDDLSAAEGPPRGDRFHNAFSGRAADSPRTPSRRR